MSAARNLPSGWTETTFGSVVSPVSTNEKKLPRGQYLQTGRFPVVDQGQQFIGGYSDDETRLISKDLPLLVFGDHTRAFKYLNQPFVPGADGVKVLKPIGVDAKWLYEIAHVLEFPNKGYSRHYQHLKSAKLLVPPLPEQRRIVAEIEKQFTRLEAGVAALRRVQANLKRYRAAVLKAACEGRLVPTEAELAAKNAKSTKKNSALVSASSVISAVKNWGYETGTELLARILTERRQNWQGRRKYKEPAAPDTANLPKLPEGWCWAGTEQVTSGIDNAITIGPFGSNLMVKNYREIGVPLIFVREIRSENFRRVDTRYISPQKASELLIHKVRGGDVVITKMGEPPGDTAIYPENLPDAIATSDCIKLTPNSSGASAVFLKYVIRGQPVKNQIERITRGVAQKKMSLARFKTVAIPLPPLAEQARIVAEVERRLSVVEESESVVSANLQRATRLRQSILQKAFTGELLGAQRLAKKAVLSLSSSPSS